MSYCFADVHVAAVLDVDDAIDRAQALLLHQNSSLSPRSFRQLPDSDAQKNDSEQQDNAENSEADHGHKICLVQFV